MSMPVPGETANTPNKSQLTVQQQKVNTPPKQENKQMIKAATPQKPQQQQQNNNSVKLQPSTPNINNNSPVKSSNNQANTNIPKKESNNSQQQNNNANKNVQNKNQNNGNNKNNGMNNNNNNNNSNNNNNGNNNNKQNNGQNNNNRHAFDKSKQFNNHNKQPFDKSKYHLNRNNDSNQKQNGDHSHGYGYNNKFEPKEQNVPQVEKKFTGRCRLFCGNLPADLNENEFKDLFKKFGETGECFLNTQRSFGFIKLDTRINAEHAKQELDGTVFKGRTIRVRFATHGAAVKVKNLSPYISNEYLEQAFSMFGPVERAVVIVDDKGRPTGEGIVEFERKPASVQCINKCQENCFILTSYPKPIVVEPLEQKDEEDGLPEKSIIKNSQFYMEREVQAHFASHNSNEHKLAVKWRELYELEKQINEEGKRRIEQAKEMLEYEIEQALIENKTMQLKEDLRMKQEELQRIEDMRKGEFARRQDLEMRRIDEERQRQEQMMMMQKQGGNMPNQRGGNNNNQMQGQFDQQNQMNQPNQALGAMQGNNNNNQRRGNNMNNQQNNFNNQNNQQFPGDMNNQDLNSLPPAQQQALIAAQLSFAMAAAAQQGNMNMGNGMFDQNDQMQQQQQQNNNNFNNGNNNHGNGGHKHHRDDHRGGNSSSGGNNRRQFDRRGGNNRGGNRDDSYPGYDTKRARF